MKKTLQEVINQDINKQKMRKLEKFIIYFEEDDENENENENENIENLFLGWYINKFLLKNNYNINE